MHDRNSFSISDPIRTKESDHCLVMVQFNMLPPSSPTSHPGRGTNPAIQVQGQWEIIFLSLGKRDPGRWRDESKTRLLPSFERKKQTPGSLTVRQKTTKGNLPCSSRPRSFPMEITVVKEM